jgi:RNA polymerase sigma-70 factor (ECF subfamily)
LRIGPEFEELYRREHQAVFRAVYALSGRRAVAEDSTQEAFARALERWRRLRDQPWVAGWITVTALNVARRAMRRTRSIWAAPQTGNEPEEAADLWRAVRLLPRRQQEAIVLRYVADLPLADVAGAMGCAEGTAKAHLARAREALREQLEGVRDD